LVLWFGSIDDGPYLRHRQNIPLMPPQAANGPGDNPQSIAKSWQAGEFQLDELVPGTDGESRVSGCWLLQATSPTQITGSWTAPDAGKTLPISLHKATPVGPRQTGGDCEQAFYEPLLAAIHPKQQAASIGSHSYQAVSSDEATTLQVPADLPHAKALNQFAMQWLRNQSVLAHDCSAGRGARGFGSTSEPIGNPCTGAVDGCLPRAARQHA